MSNPIALLFNSRRLLLHASSNDIKARYTGTLLGLFWIVLYPILFLGLYSIIYLFIFQVRLPNVSPFEYVLLIFCGLVPFLGFAEALGAGVGSVVANVSLIKNTLFPIELIPVKAVFTSSITMLVGLVLLVAVLWANAIFSYSQLFVPVIFLMQIIFTIGIMWLLSCINVFIRDLSQLITVFVLFLMLISPIAYTMDMIPEKLLPLLYPNPLYYLITLYRETMIYGNVPWQMLGVFSGISVFFFFLGFLIFSKLKPTFIDYV